MEKLTFTAFDFETMTSERTSACAIGIARVVDNVIVEKYYSLIKPIPDNSENTNTFVNGISMEMVQDAPTFVELWQKIENYFKGQTIVAHGLAFDLDVLQKQISFYGIGHVPCRGIDTYELTGYNLVDSCQKFDIPFTNHHDALADATACAEMVLVINGVKLPETHEKPKNPQKTFSGKRVQHDTLQPLSEDEVENKDTIFFKRRVVLTGDLQHFSSRQQISEILRKLGADINTAISKRTEIVVVGDKPGPSKMEKIATLQSQGVEIKVINEQELLAILREANA
ncbi:exonuclease domain-containing protein [Hallella colorans]|uniref:exonuclease domain-containing protein n=1 Tax=Hallella colorans TaxID=1703337 RepID=UPI00288C27C4|nr:exonuclease domain-containing protein [Hallella colorans]